MEKPDFQAVIIEASAGTGKTSRITKEFTGLLDRENPAATMGRVLAITFSEKAAIEMKTRILERIYGDIYPFLDERAKVDTENAMVKLNISTIHSFCRRILRRFAFYLDIDPFFKVADEGTSNLLFYRAFGKVLNYEKAESLANGILKDIKLSTLKDILHDLRKSHPYVTAGITRGDMTGRIASFFSVVSELHSRMKNEFSFLDFNDLENITCRLLGEHPEALTILEDFDEMFNYIFVDEFQDTNILQWKIIHKFSEEWLAGYGAKAERGESYGIFLVGDKKQSIYKFRGAESGIFDVAKDVMSGYSKEEQLSRNYRSSKGLLDFINKLFENIPPWDEQKLYPGLPAEVPPRIEINLLGGSGAKEFEYNWVISKIFELVEKKFPVWDKHAKKSRPMDFKDIAILMRGRAGKNFTLLEKKLKNAGLPFVILGGIGFYNESEIMFLLAVLFALADPTDFLSLWTLSNSVHRITRQDIYRWRKRLIREDITTLFENILEETGFWHGLGTQQKANAEKFLMILQDWQHMPVYSIAKNLRDLSINHAEAKADIFSIHQNAVRVLTVHGSKGLEFPAVFLVNIEDGSVVVKDRLLYEKAEGEIPYRYILKNEAEKKSENNFRSAQRQEETRVLYVALTRACHYLFISGEDKKGDSRLWLNMIRGFEDTYPATSQYGYKVFEYTGQTEDSPVFNKKGTVLTSYSREQDVSISSYGKAVKGQIAHKLLNDLSTGKVGFSKQDFMQRVNFYLMKSGLRNIMQLRDFFSSMYERIAANREIRGIIKKNIPGRTFSELPFIAEIENRMYEGFIDRVILDDKTVYIYDYKTERVEPSRYKKQMGIYETAVRNIFKADNVRKFIISLENGEIYELK